MPRTFVAVLVAVVVATACSSDDAAGEAGDMSDAVDEVRSRAGTALDVPAATIEIDGPVPVEGSGCSLYSAWDPASTNPFAREYAVLPDGTVVEGLTDDALRRTLDGCFFDSGTEPSAEAVAGLAVRLADAPGPVDLLDAEVGPRRLEPLGVEWRPPTSSGSVAEGDLTVSYFARDRETGTILAGTVTRAADGAVEVDYRRL
ncbi:MAG: hypothetical protein ACR2QO_22080 [Acidimicrobiales bacterium]